MKELSDRIPIQTQKWIMEHPHATNLDVPENLLKEWLCYSEFGDGEPNDLQMCVFTLGMICQKMIENPDIAETRVELTPAVLAERFHHWQLKLVLAMLHKRGEYIISPLPLFRFSEDEDVQLQKRFGISERTWMS